MNYLTKTKKTKSTSALLNFILRSQHQNSYAPQNKDVNPDKRHISESNAIKSPPFDRRGFDDVVSSNRLITSYVRAGNLNSAFKVFKAMEIKTTVTWNSILAGYAKKPGKMRDARDLFDKIPQPDTVSYNTMLTCYLKNCRAETAMEFFESIPAKDAVSWNTMISGFAQERKMQRARELFLATPVKNGVTWSAMISGYADCGEMASAEKLFDSAPVKTAVAWTAMITGHMKAGNIESAEKLFRSPAAERNVVTWNAMIAGYVENRVAEEALKLFVTMVASAAEPNPSTLTSVLNGCSELSALQTGRTVHQMVQKSPIRNDIATGTAIVTMYCKCGDVDAGRRFFLLEMPSKDVVTWNAMITGLAYHGAGFEALNLFREMRSGGSEPDRVTLWAVLLACSHAGLVETGLEIFWSMARDHGIEPGVEHYSSVVGLLARAGRLTEAKHLIKNTPPEMRLHPAAFGTLLSACGTHGDRQVAEYAAERLLRVDPSSAAAYVQLAKVYGAAGEWDRVSGVRGAMMRNGGAVKAPGVSWIEVKGTVHEFRSDDRDHPEIESIQAMLSELDDEMRSRRYVPDLDFKLAEFHKLKQSLDIP